MLRKPKLLLISSRRLLARWPTSAASTSVAAKVASLVNKPDNISYEMFCQDALEYLQKYHSNSDENANDFIERAWSCLPSSTKRRYKSFKDGQTFLLMDYHFEALKKLKRFDEIFILPRQHFAKAKQAEIHRMLPGKIREAAKSQSLTDLTSNSWLTLASAQRLKYSWYAYREVNNLKGSIGCFGQDVQAWHRLILATVKEEMKMANEFQRPIGNYRGDRKPSERSDHALRQFELDLAAWEAKMAATGLSHVTKQLQCLEQHQLLLRLTRIFAMLRKPKLVVTSSRRLFARWQTSAASTSIAAKVTSLLNKPDDLSYELFCQDALEYLQKYHNKDNANVFVERTWSALPWSTKFRYKHLKDWQTFLIMTYHFKALEKLKRFDGALILPRQQFAKAKQAASTHNVLPQQTRAAKRQSLTVSNSWLTLDSTQRLKYSWNAYREVIALKGNMGGFSREAQIWYRLIRATVRDEVKMANEFQRPIGNYRGDKKPSEKRDRDLRQFELDLAAWEAKMAAMDSSGVARRLQGIEQHQLLLRLTRNARWSTIAVTFAVIVTVTLVTVAQILDALIKPLKEELSARTKKK